MTQSTPPRERVLHALRRERVRQIQQYGSNSDLRLGFGGSVAAYPWLLPYSDVDSSRIEAAFRADYEQYEQTHGQPTWMHLIREEVAELFDAQTSQDVITEAIQVAALCVSLVELVISQPQGGDQW